MRNHRKKLILAILVLTLVSAVLVPAAAYAVGTSQLDIRGSTTVGPIINAGLAAYNAAQPGGSTIANVALIGSGAGITALSNDQCDIAMSSRELTSAEDAWADAYPLARDAICIIVSDEVPAAITQLTKDQIKGIYQGTITNWNQINPAVPSTPIIPRARILDSGTRSSLLEMCGISSSTEQTVINNTGLPRLNANVDMRDAINNATDAQIGYVGLGFSDGANMRELAVINPGDSIAYMPTEINVYAWRYPLARYLYLVIHDNDPNTTPNPGQDNYAYKTACINWWRQLDGIGQDCAVNQGFLRLVPDADVTGDGQVINISDRTTVGNYMGMTGNPHWVRADVNRNGGVNVTDRTIVGNWMGTVLTKP